MFLTAPNPHPKKLRFKVLRKIPFPRRVVRQSFTLPILFCNVRSNMPRVEHCRIAKVITFNNPYSAIKFCELRPNEFQQVRGLEIRNLDNL